MTRTIMMLLVPAILIVPLATDLVTVQPSRAEPAVNECKTKPDSSAPAGSHWYYRVNRADQRHCWYLGPEGAKVRSQAREGASPTRTARENWLPGQQFSSVLWHSCWLGRSSSSLADVLNPLAAPDARWGGCA